MSALEAMGAWVQSEGAGTLGVDLFLARMPDEPDSCITVYEYDGGSPIEVLGPTGIAVDRIRMQFMGRSSRDDYPTVRNQMLELRQSISSMVGTVIAGEFILRARPLGYINQLGYDDENRWRISFNAEVLVNPNYVEPATAGFGLQPFGVTSFGG